MLEPYHLEEGEVVTYTLTQAGNPHIEPAVGGQVQVITSKSRRCLSLGSLRDQENGFTIESALRKTVEAFILYYRTSSWQIHGFIVISLSILLLLLLLLLLGHRRAECTVYHHNGDDDDDQNDVMMHDVMISRL